MSNLKLRPEVEILLCCVRPRTPENDQRIQSLLDQGVNWSDLLACSLQHKLGPMLHERLHALHPAGITREQEEALAKLATSAAARSFAFLNEMLRVCSLFNAAGIPAVPFKGPALGWLAYPNFSQRTCSDLDLIVPQRFIPAAMQLVQSHGYRPLFDAIEAEAGQDRPAPGQYAFMTSSRQLALELHTERTLRYFSRPIDLEAMSSRLITLEIAGQSVRTFSVEDLLVMLSVHGAKHFWERLAWIVDIGQLVTTCEVHWEVLEQIADRTKSTRLLLLGLYLAHEVLDVSLPEPVLERARADAEVRWLAGKVFEQLASNSNSSFGVVPRAIYRLRASDGRWRGLRQLVRLSLSPTESDRKTVRLPGFLMPLYAFVRPLRLLREYGLGLDRRAKPDLAIYLPTPPEIIEQMLRLADISPRDVLCDLGCGDGRIVVDAAKKYGIRAIGVDINPRRIAEARANARHAGVEELVEFVLGDAKKVDFSEASVVILFLGAEGNLRLADRLRAELRDGSRIISRDFDIYGWPPERSEEHTTANGASVVLHRWVIKKTERESVEAVPVPPKTTSSK